MAPRPAVFLDRDGTLNVQLVRDGMPYAPERLEDFVLYEGAAEGCRALKAAGFVLVVATNQPDVGRGLVAQAVIESMHGRLLEWIPEIDRVEVSYDAGRGRRRPGASRSRECCWMPPGSWGSTSDGRGWSGIAGATSNAASARA